MHGSVHCDETEKFVEGRGMKTLTWTLVHTSSSQDEGGRSAPPLT